MSRSNTMLIAICFIALAAACSVTLAEDVKPQGKAVFDHWCWQCHGEDNPHGSGSWALAKRPGDTRTAYLERRSDLSGEFIKLVVRQGQLFMPKFRYTEISSEELAALASYLTESDSKESKPEGDDLE